MTFEQALEKRLAAEPDIVSSFGGRIIWGRRLEALPELTLQIVSDPRPQHLKGFQRTRATDVQCDVWSADPDEAATLRDLIIDRIVGPKRLEGVTFQRAMITNTRGGSEQAQPGSTQRYRGELFRQSIDITFTHDA